MSQLHAHKKFRPMLLAVCLAVLTHSPWASADDAKQRLIEQKIKLLESLLNSPSARGAAYGTEAESALLVEQGRQAIEAARQSAAQGQYEAAGQSLDGAMRAVSQASRKLKASGSLTESAQQKTYADQSEQVATYRASLAQMADGGNAEAKKALSHLDGQVAEARLLQASNRLGDANRRLAEAYRYATEEITRLRQGQEVVMTLNFSSPAEEYAYEEKRYASNASMVDMMINEGKAEGGRRMLVDRFVSEADRLKREAMKQADAGDFKGAVGTMERAGGQLIKALQSMGVPVF